MNDWSDGYLTDIGYTYGYYGELNPLRLAMPLVNVGLQPPEIVTACELGIGQGLSLNIHAAASEVGWYGTDFNPAQATFAQSLATAAASGAQLFDQSFAEFCARPDLPNFDFIGVHGIWSWISQENQRVLVDFFRRKLKLGGVLYISYNTQPGFAATVALRHLLSRHAEVMAVPGRGTLAKVDAAIEFMDRLVALNAGFVVANPGILERLRQIKGQNRNYVAHEYFHRDWHATPFADMADNLAEAKLSYACSAQYLDHIDALNLTVDQHRLLSEIPDPLFRQSVRDFIINTQFRRDYWVKGARRLSALEQTEMVKRLPVMLATTREDIVLNVPGALGNRELTANVYTPLLDAIGDYRVRTVGEVEEALSGSGLRFATIFEALIVLAAKGDLISPQDEEARSRVRAHTGRLNTHVIDQARGSGEVVFLASPVTGGGIAVGRFDQLFLLGLRHGRSSADELGRFAWEILAPQGQRLVRDNKVLETPEDNLAELTAQAASLLEKRLPVFRRLDVA